LKLLAFLIGGGDMSEMRGFLGFARNDAFVQALDNFGLGHFRCV
jgi:hypothetical protein